MNAARTDSNQSDIVRDLRDIGVQVESLHKVGKGFPDLLCGSNGHWVLLEIKKADGELSKDQIKFLANSKGFAGVAINSDEAIKAVERPSEFCLSRNQKDRLAAWLILNPKAKTLSVRKYRKIVK